MKLNRQGRPYLGLFQERKEIELNSAETKGGFVFLFLKVGIFLSVGMSEPVEKYCRT